MATNLVPANIREASRAHLQSLYMHSRQALKRSQEIGGAGHALVSHGTSMVVRHSMTSLLGAAKDMQTWQRVVCGVLATFGIGVRVGLSHSKMTPAMVSMAAGLEGLSAAMIERLLESFAHLNPD